MEQNQKKQLKQIISSLDLCSCACGNEYEVMLFILNRAHERQVFCDENLLYGCLELVVKLLSSYTIDLLEHGTSVHWSWLTEKGQLLQEFLQQYGTDQDEWPEWVTNYDIQY
jgi:hypothetical protein